MLGRVKEAAPGQPLPAAAAPALLLFSGEVLNAGAAGPERGTPGRPGPVHHHHPAVPRTRLPST